MPLYTIVFVWVVMSPLKIRPFKNIAFHLFPKMFARVLKAILFQPRYQEVAKIIEASKFSVVFLQEVISEALRYFDETLENYRQDNNFLTGL